MRRNSAWGLMRELLAAVATIGDLATDEPDLRTRKHAMTLTAAALLLATLAWIAIGIVVENHLLVWSSVAFATILGAALVQFRASRRLNGAVQALLASGLAYVAVGHVALGGFVAGGGSLVWGLLAPVAAALFLDAGNSLRWFAAYAALVLGAIVVGPSAPELLPAGGSSPPPVALFAYNVLGPGLVVLALVRYVDGRRYASQQALHRVLTNVLPHHVADQLAAGERPSAEHHADATVVFVDVVNFTTFAARHSASEVVLLLNELFSAFDAAAARFGVQKIKTVGDGYLCVAGLGWARTDHARHAVQAALAMREQVRLRKRLRERGVQLRIGVASGPVTAGIIGRELYAYDVWGHTVNLAARLQTTALPGEIHVSASTALAVPEMRFTPGRAVTLKGLRHLATYTLAAGDDPTAVPSRSPARSLPAAPGTALRSTAAAT